MKTLLVWLAFFAIILTGIFLVWDMIWGIPEASFKILLLCIFVLSISIVTGLLVWTIKNK